ncbi:hypothetical protein JHK85_000462 [Glycine max]|nr:hypothetical protein JHK85_000462 [Glycine max]
MGLSQQHKRLRSLADHVPDVYKRASLLEVLIRNKVRPGSIGIFLGLLIRINYLALMFGPKISSHHLDPPLGGFDLVDKSRRANTTYVVIEMLWKMVTILGLVPAQAILYPQLCEALELTCAILLPEKHLFSLALCRGSFPLLSLSPSVVPLSSPSRLDGFFGGLSLLGTSRIYNCGLSPKIFRHMFYTLIQNVVSVDNASISIIGKAVVGGIFGVVAQVRTLWLCCLVSYRQLLMNGHQVFSGNLYGSIPDVVVPLMYTEYTTRKVLVMEWIEVRAYALVIPELIDLKDDLQKHLLIESACPLNINNALLMECPSAPATSIGGTGSSVIMILLYLMSMEKLL